MTLPFFIELPFDIHPMVFVIFLNLEGYFFGCRNS
jgi:hypothetical protein